MKCKLADRETFAMMSKRHRARIVKSVFSAEQSVESLVSQFNAEVRRFSMQMRAINATNI
jgi:hypothetical protein